MKQNSSTKPARRKGLGRFLFIQIVLGAAAFLLAYFAARWADSNAPGFLSAIAALLPSWSPVNPTGFAVAYVFFAAIVYISVNALLFMMGYRKL